MKYHNGTKPEEEEDDETISSTEDLFKIYSRSTTKQHDIYLSDNVESESANYIDLLKFFDTRDNTDLVIVHLANFGGACHSGIRLAHAIKNTDAAVSIAVDAPCYSMGAILALTGDDMAMREGTFLMFHNYSTVETGKGGEVLSAVNEYARHFYKSLEFFCCPFLSKKEINLIKKDKDVYIHAEDEDLQKRLKRHFKLEE